MIISVITKDPATVAAFKSKANQYIVHFHSNFGVSAEQVLQHQPEIIFIDFFSKDEILVSLYHQLRFHSAQPKIPVVAIAENDSPSPLAKKMNYNGLINHNPDKFLYVSVLAKCLQKHFDISYRAVRY